VTVTSLKSTVVDQISLKSDELLSRYGVLTIFQMAAVHPPSWIYEFSRLCHVTSIAILCCFPEQNFTTIAQSAAELWHKNEF